jgi:hypothetical protein
VQRRMTPLLVVRVRISPVVHHQNGRTNPNSTSSSHTYVFLASRAVQRSRSARLRLENARRS